MLVTRDALAHDLKHSAQQVLKPLQTCFINYVAADSTAGQGGLSCPLAPKEPCVPPAVQNLHALLVGLGAMTKTWLHC